MRQNFKNTFDNDFGIIDNNTSICAGGDLILQDTKLLNFAQLLYELSKYNSDLKAILENSKLFTEQNQNQNSGVDPYASQNNNTENPFLDSDNVNTKDDSKDNSFPSKSSVAKVINDSSNSVNISESKFINKDKGIITVGGPGDAGNANNTNENNASIPESKSITLESIYDLLTSKWTIWINVSKLPKEVEQLVNRLVNNNSLDNQNEIKTVNMNSAPPLSGNNISNHDEVVQENQDKLVHLSASQFQDLIYYFIINAVAKENNITVVNGWPHTSNFTDAWGTIHQQYSDLIKINNSPSLSREINSKTQNASDSIDTIVSGLKNKVENGELQEIIHNNVGNKNESSSFWVQFLFSVLKRASFFYSIYKIFDCNQKLKAFETLKQGNIAKRRFPGEQKIRSDRQNHLIDTFLSIPQILFLLSLIFGFGAIANVILGLIVLATLFYKFISQYPKQKRKFLVYKLLQSEHFKNIARQNGFALIPEVAKIYQYGEQMKTDIQKIGNQKLSIINNNITGYIQNQSRQYPSLEQLNPFGAQPQGYLPNPFGP